MLVNESASVALDRSGRGFWLLRMRELGQEMKDGHPRAYHQRPGRVAGRGSDNGGSGVWTDKSGSLRLPFLVVGYHLPDPLRPVVGQLIKQDVRGQREYVTVAKRYTYRG